MKKALWILLIAVAAPLALAAANVDTSASSAAAAFERLKALAGTWQMDGNMGKGEAVYEVVANGSTVIERVTVQGMSSPMITMYHLNGDKLQLTHYCMLGNQPSMVARSIDPATGEIIFDFAGVSNLSDPNGKYMHNAALKLGDRDSFTAAWTLYENGKAANTEQIQYKRIR